MIRVADYIAKFIYDAGVKDVFMLSGGGMMHLSDGLALHPELNVICNHHEQAAAMAGVGYAKYKNDLAVVYVTTGCGGTNAITGLLNAWQDSSPVIFISGQVKSENTIRKTGFKIRQFGVQEADIISIVESICKYSVMVDKKEDIDYYLNKALYMAKNGRPGPVWLDIPMDIQGAFVDEGLMKNFDSNEVDKIETKKSVYSDLESVVKLLSLAKRPVVVAGQGIKLSDTKKEFLDFIEKYEIPVVSPFLGVGILPTDHDSYVGLIGSKGSRAGNFALQNSDLVLVLGSRLSVGAIGFDGKNFAREAKKIVIDIDTVEHSKKLVDIDMFVEMDLRDFFTWFKTQNIDGEYKQWKEKCLYWKNKWPVCLPEYANDSRGVNLYYFVDQLSKQMSGDAVVVSDAGSSFYATTQAINLKKQQRYITSGGQAEMGYTLPACIGVSVARKNGEVLGITGDGSFQLNIQELQTVVHHQLPIKLFVWNNNGYLSIRATQRKFFENRLIGTDKTSGVSFPEVKKIAEAYGIKYVKISNSQEVVEKINEVLSYNCPVLCEVICISDQEIVPTVSSFKRDDGKMVSKPMEDMYPFLSREEFFKEMIIKPLDE